MPQSETVTIYVTYSGTAADRFDRAYYVESHLPLVIDAWGPSGLLSCVAFFPDEPAASTGTAKTVVICQCVFRDGDSLATAFASARTPEVMADVGKFTDLVPQRARAISFQ
jgi:uncharacterized protein (TIGR02118 family)